MEDVLTQIHKDASGTKYTSLRKATQETLGEIPLHKKTETDYSIVGLSVFQTVSNNRGKRKNNVIVILA